MRLVQDRSAGAQNCTVTCIAEAHTGTYMGAVSRRFQLSQGFADTEGEPFQAYYCRACAERIAPDQVARAVAEEDQRRAYGAT